MQRIVINNNDKLRHFALFLKVFKIEDTRFRKRQ